MSRGTDGGPPDTAEALFLANALFDAVRHPLLVLSDDLRVKQANSAFYHLFQTTAGETLDRPLRDLDDGQWGIPALQGLLEDARTSRVGFDNYEVHHVFPRIGRKIMLLNARLVAPDSGHAATMLLAFEDVTQRLEAEEEVARYRLRLEQLNAELATSNAELARSNADLEQFAFAASHDLQEPLRMVSSYTQLLARRYRGRLDAEADEFIGFAVDGAARMKQLIDDLLAYSRAGRSRDFTRVSLDETLDRALAHLKDAVAREGAKITRHALPHVRGDAGQLASVFQNLIGNAIKFRREEPPLVDVEVSPAGREWRISVRDNGIGIESEHYARIFSLFKRQHTRADYSGNGIGLSLCKKIVDRHGGRIWVESDLGRGSAFHFTLPMREDA